MAADHRYPPVYTKAFGQLGEWREVPDRALCLRLAVDSIPQHTFPPMNTNDILNRADAFVAYLADEGRVSPVVPPITGAPIAYPGYRAAQSRHRFVFPRTECARCGVSLSAVNDGLAPDCPK